MLFRSVTNFYIEPIPPNPPLTKGGQGGFRGKKQGSAAGIQRSGKKNTALIKSVSKGLLVLEAMGVHTANPVSGDFSIGVSGLWIENGEIAYPVKEALVSGNILDLFMRIQGVGDDLKFYDKIGSPSLLIGEMDISA